MAGEGRSTRAVWARSLAVLGLILVGPMLLGSLVPFLGWLARLWIVLLALALWVAVMVWFMGRQLDTPLQFLEWAERHLRTWTARFDRDPEGLWIAWAHGSRTRPMARWCLDQALACGGAEARFEDALAWLEAGLGPTEGVLRLETTAQLGHPEAAFRLAEALRTGHGGLPDPAGAVRWYRQAAEAGFGRAAAWLARAYAVGDGVAADEAEARRWDQAARASAPHPPLRPSAYQAGQERDPLVRFAGGLAERMDGRAERIFAQTRARRALGLAVGLALLAGGGLLAAWLGVVFLAGSAGLHFLPVFMLVPPLGLIFLQWLGLRRDRPKRGPEGLRRAAEGGDPEACFRLGQALARGGGGIPRDDVGAALWFRRAAEAGHPDAMRALAEAYRGGHGVIRDPREAARWEAAAGEGKS